MLLNDIGKSPDSTFKKINQHLQLNYGFKISEDVSDKDLVSIMEKVEDEIVELKMSGDTSKNSPEISKRLLVLEGIKTLREYALMGFQSPDLQKVVSNLTHAVLDLHRLSAHDESGEGFEEAVRDAMKAYRSSEYRFPDDMIEAKVRQAAISQLQQTSAPDVDSQQDMTDPMISEEDDMDLDGIDEDDSAFSSIGKRASATGGHAGEVPDTDRARFAMKTLNNPALSLKLEPKDDEMVPMIRDKSGRMVPDPFAAQAAARKKGIVMKEKESLIKNLRRLLETEVSQAEVMMAAKGFSQELQEMVEKVGRLQNEDLPPVTDQMRETFGTESASAFQTQIYGVLQNVMDALYTAKGQVDDAVTNMAATGQVSASVDMDKEVGMDDMGMDDGMGAEPDLDNIGDDGMDLGAEDDLDMDLDTDIDDDFGAAAGDESLGRAKKMEAMKLQKKVLEMRKLVERAKKLRESARK